MTPIKILSLTSFLIITVLATPLPAQLLTNPYYMPFDAGRRTLADPPVLPTQDQMYRFAWDSFIALNWQYENGAIRGEPDTTAPPIPIFGNAPNEASPFVVWETYFVPPDVFIPNPPSNPNDYPVIWGQPSFLDINTGFRNLIPTNYGPVEFFAPGINQPYTHANVPTGPVSDKNRNYLRYEVTMGQSYFDYVRTFQYYNANIQTTVVQNYIDFAWANQARPPANDTTYFQPVPNGTEPYVPQTPWAQQGMVEVKASWRVLSDNDVPQRYFRRLMRLPIPSTNPQQYEDRLMGLTGLHIHRVTPTGHLPSTFEHIDNVKLFKRPGDPLPLPATPALNPGPKPPFPYHWFKRFPYLKRFLHYFVAAWNRHYQNHSSPPYPNGYEVNGLTGQPGIIPPAFLAKNDPIPPVDQRREINVSRSTPIPKAVQEINRQYQSQLGNSVWRYYQLIGTQGLSGTENNPYVTPNNPNLGPGIPNKNLGPGIPGPQYSETTDLVNSTLESYTQPGWSCARCHINAFPHGVDAFPPYEDYFTPLHVMSFLLLTAHPEAPAP
ncbi:MAG: hypothetical protein AAF591_23285 [Verrucomicrobiota bacterium]